MCTTSRSSYSSFKTNQACKQGCKRNREDFGKDFKKNAEKYEDKSDSGNLSYLKEQLNSMELDAKAKDSNNTSESKGRRGRKHKNKSNKLFEEISSIIQEIKNKLQQMLGNTENIDDTSISDNNSTAITNVDNSEVNSNGEMNADNSEVNSNGETNADNTEPSSNGETTADNSGVSSTSGNNKGSTPSKSGNNDLDRWDQQIKEAAESTGLPANFIKATIWAESRGNPNDPSQNPDGKHQDLGVMQISDYTYSDVMKNQPNAPKGLQAGNQSDNIMMGAWELKDKLEKAGGDYKKTSEAYVGHGDSSDAKYAGWVNTYWQELNNGQKLSDF